MKFAIVGNPNSGKTTLFNTLTGSTAHVGNWPGVTVDRKEGIYRKLPEAVYIVDLPGIYSLSPYTPEEIIARNYIIEENPDLIINIIDATNLERNLYLTTQILEMDCPVIIALNMMDILKKDGAAIDVSALERKLSVPVVEISALRDLGIKQLMERAYSESKSKRAGKSVLESFNFKNQLNAVFDIMREHNVSHPVFHAVKLLEGDKIEKAELHDIADVVSEIRRTIKISDVLDGDFEAAVADFRYRYITDELKPALVGTKAGDSLSRSDKIDRLLTHKWLGIPVFFVFMLLVFHFTFTEDLFFLEKFGVFPDGGGIPSPGVWLQGIVEAFIGLIVGGVSVFLQICKAPDWIFGLIIDGVFAGLGTVLSFLPQIMLLFLFLSIMEDTGYMARAAFLMDRVLRRFGLSGKAFMPLLMGFGCSVPAMMGTRTLENDKERRLTIMLLPFFSCGAKLPIWAMFAAAFSPENADLMIFGIYFLGIVTSIIAALILNKFIFKGESSPFIMELPAYHLPRLKNLIMHLWDKLRGFIYRAATIIAGATVIIWFLANFNFALQMVEPNSADSILGFIGGFLRPVFIPLGFVSGNDGWRAVVAILTGLIAKEMVVSTMGVLYNPGIEGDALEDSGAHELLIATLMTTFSPLAAVSFMAFNLLSVPCMAAVATAHAEFRKAKYTWLTILFWIAAAWIVSFIIFNVGTFFRIGV